MRGRRPTDEERRLWLAATKDVRPLKGPGRPDPPGSKPGTEPAGKTPTAPPAHRMAQPATGRPGHQALPPPLVAHRTPQPGVDRRTAERVRKGRLPIEARLDLHGMRKAEAHHALIGFVEQSYLLGRRMVLLITGKGTFSGGPSVLRDQLPRWLNDPPLRPKVLALQPAQPKDGGDGAFYLLLRRHRGDSDQD